MGVAFATVAGPFRRRNGGKRNTYEPEEPSAVRLWPGLAAVGVRAV